MPGSKAESLMKFLLFSIERHGFLMHTFLREVSIVGSRSNFGRGRSSSQHWCLLEAPAVIERVCSLYAVPWSSLIAIKVLS